MGAISIKFWSKKCVKCGTRTEWRLFTKPTCVTCLEDLVIKGIVKENENRR